MLREAVVMHPIRYHDRRHRPDIDYSLHEPIKRATNKPLPMHREVGAPPVSLLLFYDSRSVFSRMRRRRAFMITLLFLTSKCSAQF